MSDAQPKRRRITDYTQKEIERFYRDGKPGVPLYQADGTFRAYRRWTPAERAYFNRSARPSSL